MDFSVHNFPIPHDLKSFCQPSPWRVSPELFQRINSSHFGSSEVSYKKVQLHPDDKEYKFVSKYFYHNQPKNRALKAVYVIHNPRVNTIFEQSIPNMEQNAKNQAFQSHWQEEKSPKLLDLRKKALKRFEEMSTSFSPFIIEWDKDHSDTFREVKVLPLWHGTSYTKCHSICNSGFIYFGKHALLGKGGSISQSTDSGFFGSGNYFTNSARYAADIYSDGENLLLGWVSMRSPYPVVNDQAFPQGGSDMERLKGLGAYENYNAHYIPVAPLNSDSQCPIYYPCPGDMEPVCDEFVVFQQQQTLPRFWIEMQVDLPSMVKQGDLSVGTLLTFLTRLLDAKEVRENGELSAKLESKVNLLLDLPESNSLSVEDEKFYKLAKRLLSEGEKINQYVVKLLIQSSSSPLSSQAPQTSSEKPMSHPLENSDGNNNNYKREKKPVDPTFAKYDEKLKEKHSLSVISQGNKPTPIKPSPPSQTVLSVSSSFIHDGLEEALFDACQTGDVEKIQKLIEKGVDINMKKIYSDKQVLTPVFIASEEGHLEAVKFLIQNGANIKTASKKKLQTQLADGWTPLHSASLNGHFEIVCELIRAGADVNARNSFGNTSLVFACVKGHAKIVEELIKRGANVATDTNTHLSCANPLVTAVENGNLECAEILIRNGASVNARNSCYETPLIAAYSNRTLSNPNMEMIKFLLDKGADASVNVLNPNEKGHEDDYMPILACAAMNKDFEFVKLLIEYGANIHAKGYITTHFERKSNPLEKFTIRKEFSALSVACRESENSDNLDVIELLLSKGANPSVYLQDPSDKGDADDYMPLLMFAIIVSEDVKLIKLLLKYGADAKAKGILACKFRDRSTGVVTTEKRETSMLFYAERSPPQIREEIVRLLKAHGATSDCNII